MRNYMDVGARFYLGWVRLCFRVVAKMTPPDLAAETANHPTPGSPEDPDTWDTEKLCQHLDVSSRGIDHYLAKRLRALQTALNAAKIKIGDLENAMRHLL